MNRRKFEILTDILSVILIASVLVIVLMSKITRADGTVFYEGPFYKEVSK